MFNKHSVSGFRPFDANPRIVIEGQPADMTIHCITPGKCTHNKVSWYTNHGDYIPFNGSDTHYRRESKDNLHRLWIDKGCIEDHGWFKVKKETHAKKCELNVIGK